MLLDGFGVLQACRLRKWRKNRNPRDQTIKSAILRNLGEKKSWSYNEPKVSKLQDSEVRLWISTGSTQQSKPPWPWSLCLISSAEWDALERGWQLLQRAWPLYFLSRRSFLKDMKKHQYLMRHRILTKLYMGKIMKNWDSNKIPKLFWSFRKVYFHSKSKLFLTILLNTTMKVLLGANLFLPSCKSPLFVFNKLKCGLSFTGF